MNPADPHHEHPPAAADARDAALDHNLRRIGPTLRVPDAPADGSAWRGVGRPGVRTHAAGRARPAPARRIWAALSGVAAVVAAGAAILFTTTRGSAVQAGTILESLRRAQPEGLRITLTALCANGASMDGTMHVRFDRALDIRGLVEGDPSAEPRVAQAAGRLRVRTNEASAIPGVAFDLDGALTGPESWIHARANGAAMDALPDGATAHPMATVIGAMLRGGVLLDLGAGAPARLAHALGLHAARGAGAGPSPTPSAPVLQGTLPPAIRRLLTGEAGQAELDEVVRLLREGDGSARRGPATKATIELSPTGHYVLSAVLRGPDRRASDDAVTGPLMRIAYLPGRGVPWVEFDLAGMEDGLNGLVRVEFTSDPFDPALMDRSRVVVPGRTAVITEEVIRPWLTSP